MAVSNPSFPESSSAERADLIFGAIQAEYGGHPEFSAHGERIKALINKVAQDPGGAAGKVASILNKIAVFCPPYAVELNGVASLLTILVPPSPPSSTATNPPLSGDGASGE